MEIANSNRLGRLFLAINRYVSTGDHYGEGIALELSHKKVRVLIPVTAAPKSKTEQNDFANFKALKARLEELEDEVELQLSIIGLEGKHCFWGLDLNKEDIPELINLIEEEPGPLGWGPTESNEVVDNLLQSRGAHWILKEKF